MSETNQRQCHYQYTVKRGDSFYLIAHRTGVRLRDLLEANPDIPPARLTVGDVLCIPYGADTQVPAADKGAQTEPPADTQGDTQGNEPSDTGASPDTNGPAVPIPPCPPNRRTVVQNDQTAADLMLQYGLSYHTLQNANPGTDLEEIHGGDILCIPEENTPCALPTTVTMGESDTLESIAITYNLPVAALLRANPCLAPEDFRQGAVIRLPQ
ncbi:MAG: LysM peptidoglycan-binding domain-containing protein [Clostridia bacterium]|nr:LysM peptidoglycan-binding domain-containing protein [Clostridia bacterium]